MKKVRKLLVVTTLLMVLGFVLPVAGANSDQGMTVCNDSPRSMSLLCLIPNKGLHHNSQLDDSLKLYHI